MNAIVLDNEGIGCLPAPDCPLCGESGTQHYRDLRDPMFGAPGRWGLRICRNPHCGSGWIDPMPTPQSLATLYQSYHTHDQAPVIVAPEGAASHAPALRYRLLGLLPWWKHHYQSGLNYFAHRKPGVMLDVGCGSGGFLRSIVEAGWSAVGIDFDEQAVAVASQVRGAQVFATDIFDPRFDGKKFDGILLDNVIEHVPEPGRTIARCSELLAPGGRLVMITPNVDALGHRHFGEHWRGLETPRHLHLFTRRALRKLAVSNGLRSAKVFAKPSSRQFNFMVGASEEIMRTRGLRTRRWPVAKRLLRVKSLLSALLGGGEAEFLVCIADRPARPKSR
ncbi:MULTISPECIES: class I SAM-dependent methyltransferase [Sphingobium]|uniref:class I SAM-dependent methyltransferase n=1 Tax=Sphingobium TaxID=165695 RepID=UPI0015EB2A06|nr:MULTISPECIES: class I SAM-dependent methyltransferase [Sphingobium]MCW2362330.1 2-polyprenyl-3-methyl-5-hydroxy-6-metoxy-1,4-benzoquinol methylase [Sphingobium sp. B10D3B]MCW2400991.1 2-polyprenyl-3-methyl-5-hydroxy-6-metoxy-1,4-benzoquinol methylase [Sphingobium sp. B10D7B]MCW2407970.1 2-polyprenyl-3-methyl-5-hydroxy-6-metoxy-1,4-benzoquinol methylase [Sphingobium xanthum]